MWTGREYPAGPPVEDGLTIDASDLVDGGSDIGRKKHVPPPTKQDEKVPTAAPRARRRKSR